MLCDICICLWQPVTMLHSAINIVVSLCFPPNNRRLIWPVLFFAPLFAFPGAVCFWPLKRRGNIGLCSHVVRPFVCFYYNKSTLSDYANCTTNVCMYVCAMQGNFGPVDLLSTCQTSALHPLRVFAKVGAHGNKPVVDRGVRTVRRIWFMGGGSRGTEIVSFLSSIFPNPFFCGYAKIGQYTRAWEMRSVYSSWRIKCLVLFLGRSIKRC